VFTAEKHNNLKSSFKLLPRFPFLTCYAVKDEADFLKGFGLQLIDDSLAK